MMKYQGGKETVARHIAPVLNASVASGDGTFIAPFCGGLSVESRVDADRYIIGDIRAPVVATWRAAHAGWVPPHNVSEDEYNSIKAHPEDHPPEMVGFVLTCCSWGAIFCGGYARNGHGHNYALTGSRSIRRKIDRLVGRSVTWCAGDYRDTLHSTGASSTIYCDPPYANTRGYRRAVDHDTFWSTMVDYATLGAHVYVSEQTCPVPHDVVWSGLKTRHIKQGSNPKLREHLFRIRPR